VGEDNEIVRTIIMLARNMGMDVVAEGIETEQQLASLRDLKCEFGQGFFFSYPLDADSTTELLERGGALEEDSLLASVGSLRRFT
jgi:EAL domain-containing protein (putative c-di-GMP-specific phosphodiesterase class I)